MTRPISDLSRAHEQTGEVTLVEDLGGGLVEISVRLPGLAAEARPGDFAQVRCGDGIQPLLRRPFSVAWSEGDVCAFVLEAVGVGTRLLVALKPGDPLTVLGPLGHGYSLEPQDRALIVSGGLGCAPFPLLIRHLRSAGCTGLTVLSGAATSARLYPAGRFQRGDLGVKVLEATDDGSRGHRGMITDLVIANCDENTTVYACGPNPMLAALAVTLRQAASPPRRAEVSLEAPMGCGFGTCLGCVLPVEDDGSGDPWALCCRHGPVMRAGDVDWTRLLDLPPASLA